MQRGETLEIIKEISNTIMATTTWVSDPTHSEITFKVKHLMISNVTGRFDTFAVEAQSDNGDFSNASVKFTADVATVNTGNEQRDGHLRSADFFDAENFPQLIFESTNYNAASGKLSGNLTIKGTTQPVSLDVDFSGTNKDPWGNEKAGFSLTGKIRRTDFGLSWNAALETGGVLVSEDVRISAEIQLVRQA
jgi:polyisoprenoid-binding protein YceI